MTVNNFHPLKLHEGTFLAEPSCAVEVVFADTKLAEIEAKVSFYASRRGRCHGLAGWFNAELIPGLRISNGPGDQGSHWGLAFFPIDKPVMIDQGNHIAAEISSSGNGEYWHWKVDVNGQKFDQSSRRGLPESAHSISTSFHPRPLS